jgi:hypothetical protein
MQLLLILFVVMVIPQLVVGAIALGGLSQFGVLGH